LASPKSRANVGISDIHRLLIFQPPTPVNLTAVERLSISPENSEETRNVSPIRERRLEGYP
jgi:hypothetical protein